jgi:secreted trypsin-like serine protease
MKRLLVASLSLVLLISQIQSAYAVEDGSSAAGSPYVVPVILGSKGSCSGVMIAKNVLVTAAHCILDESKQITKLIYVGPPGSKLTNGDYAKVTHTFIPDDYLGNAANNKIGDSDIAFLVIDELYSDYGVIEIASENDLISLKNKRAPLRVLGYGSTSNSGNSDYFPYFYDGVFESTYNTSLLNTFGITSTKGNACSGDSGAPILSITPRKVMLVGVLTGGLFNEGGRCSKKSVTNTYSAVFSGVSRYSNALHLALVQGTENLIQVIKDKENSYSSLADENTETLKRNTDLQLEIETLRDQLIWFNKEVAALRKMKKVITCVSGTKTKTVTGTNPICPAGYRVKK